MILEKGLHSADEHRFAGPCLRPHELWANAKLLSAVNCIFAGIDIPGQDGDIYDPAEV